MKYKYEDFDEIIDALNEERSISSEEFPEAWLSRTVWVSSWGWPGCMAESTGYSRTKEDAIEGALFYCGDEHSDPVRGAKTALRNYHRFDLPHGAVARIEKYSLSDLI